MRIGKNNSHMRKKLPSVVTSTFLEVDIAADASSGKTIKAPFPLTVIGVKAISTATVTSATVTLSDGTNAISSAVDIDTVATVMSAATIDLTYADIAAGGSLKLTTASSADRAKVLIEVIPR